MAASRLGNRLGGRLNYESQPLAPHSKENVAAPHHARLQAGLDEEYHRMHNTQSAQTSQLEQAQKDMTDELTNGEKTTLAESPWRGPLDPEQEID